MKKESTNLRGIRIPPDVGPGAFLTRWRHVIAGAVTSFLNLRVIITPPNGSPVECEVKQTDLATLINIPATAVASSSSGSVQQYKIVSDGGDYWNAKTWDGTTLGSTVVKIAKPYKLRCGVGAITSEVIRGVTYSYTYTASGIEYYRTTTGSDGSSSVDYITPPALANDIIYALVFSTATPSSLAAVTLIDINADGRAWAT